MTIREAHQEWGRKKDNNVLYCRTKSIFEKGFELLDLDKATSLYTLQDLQTALAYSSIKNQEDKTKAASVMFHVLRYAADKVPNQQHGITFTYTDILRYKPVVNLTPNSLTPNSLTPNPSPGRGGNENGNDNSLTPNPSPGRGENQNENDNDNVNHEPLTLNHEPELDPEPLTLNHEPELDPEPLTEIQPSDVNNKPALLCLASNEELLEEMRRRGWKGKFQYMVTVEL